MAELSSAAINNLPDSDFAYIEAGGSKDSEGKTIPRSLRHFPIHDAAHVRNALARASQSPFGEKAMPKIKAAAAKFNIEVGEEQEQKSTARFPKDNLVRMLAPGPELQESGTSGPILAGHFTPFNQWTKIESTYEGKFMERISPGTFKKAFSEPHRSQIKVQFDHGQDKVVGAQLIGIPIELREDDYGAKYEVELFEGLPPLLLNGLRKKVYGSSFRFRVIQDNVDQWPDRSTTNPDGWPERTIREVEVFEFGPVVNPAYAGATAGIRSETDWFLARQLAEDPRFRDILPPVEPIAPSRPDAADEPHVEKKGSDMQLAVPVRRFKTQEGFITWLTRER
jgi:phage head maturation protease